MTESKFPTAQRLAQTSDLILGVKNTGDEPLPELAFTIETDDGDGRRLLRRSAIDDPSALEPEPARLDPREQVPAASRAPRPRPGLSGGLRAQTNTFGFGSLEAGEERTIVWSVTPVQAGTYTLHYLVEAGLDGNARAVTADGGEVKGEFVVTITDKAAAGDRRRRRQRRHRRATRSSRASRRRVVRRSPRRSLDRRLRRRRDLDRGRTADRAPIARAEPRRADGARPGRRRRRRRRADRDRQLRVARLRHPAARRGRGPLRRRAGRDDPARRPRRREPRPSSTSPTR